MAAFYQSFTTRATEPDLPSLLALLRSVDPSIGIQHDPGAAYVLKKSTAWLGTQITAAQSAIDTAPATTPQLIAQTYLDAIPLELKAIVLTLIDQLNLVRATIPGGAPGAPPLAALTPAQALAAIRTKAGTLS
jgi:hypothetical protein